MQEHPEVPKLPKLPFVASDLFLLLVAGFIAYRAPAPFEGGALIAIVTCVVVGGILLGVPFIAEYGRRTDVLLRERQDEIAALAKTTATCAEQISIATASLHSLAESYARSARTLEALPQRLQEKVAEFKAQLNEINLAENEALEQELQTLRTAESDRLQSAVDELTKLAREFARVETAANQISTSLTQIGEQSAARLTASVTQTTTGAAKEIDAVIARARQQLSDDSKQAEARAAAANDSLRSLESRLDALARKLAASLDSAAPLVTKPSSPAPQPTPKSTPTTAAAADSTAKSAPAPSLEPLGPRQNEDARSALPAAVPASLEPSPSRRPAEGAAPAPAPNEGKVAAAPTPSATTLAPAKAPTPVAPALPPTPVEPVAPPPPAAARRPAERGPSTPVEAALSSDGATRLLVTAYIGIGNKLFARGSGPGLSWEKGVPLHFVSIGKWRWDTAEASGPVQIKLYKNDQTECTAVGTLELEPGHQHEVTATF